jgi:hypothetical protein
MQDVVSCRSFVSSLYCRDEHILAFCLFVCCCSLCICLFKENVTKLGTCIYLCFEKFLRIVDVILPFIRIEVQASYCRNLC